MKRVALETERVQQEESAESNRKANPRRSAKRSVSVRLGGKEYNLRSDADEEWLQQVASYVDKSMQQIRERTDTVDSLDIALLAALNLAREVLQLRQAADGKGREGLNSERLRDLIEMVETELSVAPSSATY